MKFFIPDDPDRAEAAWQEYLKMIGNDSAADRARVFTITYLHDGDRYAATVGKRRQRFPRRTGPRGGYIKDAEPRKTGFETGTVITTVVAGRRMFYVWSYPPYEGFNNPTYVGLSGVESVEYFDDTASNDKAG